MFFQSQSFSWRTYFQIIIVQKSSLRSLLGNELIKGWWREFELKLQINFSLRYHAYRF